MNKYISILCIALSLLTVTSTVQAKPSAPIYINHEVINDVSIDETISHELNVLSNIALTTLSVTLSVKSGLTLDENVPQYTVNGIKAGENIPVLFNATYTNTVGYIIVDISAIDVNGNTHYKNKVIKYGSGNTVIEKLSKVSTVNEEKLILMPAQSTSLK